MHENIDLCGGRRAVVVTTATGALAPDHVVVSQLRHSCGFKLANDHVDTRTIQDYLGHADISNTVRYTKLQDGKFRGIWKD